MPNFDEKTGIRYGVISPHSISGNSDYDLYEGPNSTDPIYESTTAELRVYAGEIAGNSPIPMSEDLQEKIADLLIDDFSEGYENQDGQMDYSDKEYDLHVSGDNFGIFVMRSPYYTYCRGCSPCAPGAGDLNSPIDPVNLDLSTLEHISAKTLCLGHEWFDQDNDQYSRKIPYRVFRVSDDTEVLPEDES
ncbi:MAG: hypothetical protein M0Q91_17675 [Methanoregula sp.]|jgi:hypothetical protein|nr:hypothetical protein [Methanoregula sp.]